MDELDQGRKCVQCGGDISEYSEEYDRCVWCEYEVVGT
jgi:hypothetical protein